MAQQHHAIDCRIILFGRLPLQTMLQTLLDPTLSLETIELKPWTLEQTRHFLMHSLAHMDIHEEATLDDALVENIHTQSNGIPKNVAILAEAAFQQYQQPPQFRNQPIHDDETTNHTADHNQQGPISDDQAAPHADYEPTTPRWTKHWVKTTCVIALIGVLFGLHRYENSMTDQMATVIAAPPKPAPTVAALPPVVAPVAPSKPKPAPAAHIKPAAPIAVAAPVMPYRLQLMASANRQKLQRLAQSTALAKQKPYIIAKQSHGKTLYTLNIGHYANAQSARHALKQLPKAIQVQKPWLTHG
jgi:septal ring-binding cell division protein DamX